MNQRIFTYWEPKNKIPAYLKLCMGTWEKYLSDYEIIVLDKANINNYIKCDTCVKYLFNHFSYAKQADAIRCLVLNKYGGLWLDADTIITSEKIKDILDITCDFTLINKHIAFIKANAQSKILNLWEKEIMDRIVLHKKYKYLAKFFDKDANKFFKSFDYLGNGILNKYLDIAAIENFQSINADIINAFPENNYFKPKTKEETIDAYRKFWFEYNLSDYLEKENLGNIILLHNSWTPKKFKNLSKEEVLEKDCTFSSLLKKIGV